jgi:hypothetical protein
LQRALVLGWRWGEWQLLVAQALELGLGLELGLELELGLGLERVWLLERKVSLLAF